MYLINQRCEGPFGYPFLIYTLYRKARAAHLGRPGFLLPYGFALRQIFASHSPQKLSMGSLPVKASGPVISLSTRASIV